MTSSFSYDSSWTIIISFSDISFWKNIRHTISAISFQRGHSSFSPDYQPFCAEAKVGRPQVLECCDAYSAVFIIPQIPTTSQPASRAHTFILVNLKRQWWDACSFKKMIFQPSFKDLYALLIMRYCSVHMLHHGLKSSPTVPFIAKVNICVRCDWTKIWGSVYLQWHFIQMWMKWCLIKK